MFTPAAEEISQWAERLRIWARGARTAEQRSVLHGFEQLLRSAALEAEHNWNNDTAASAPLKS